ncbi:MAG: hypothetical protein ABL886_11735 [Rhodoglobus sp.]
MSNLRNSALLVAALTGVGLAVVPDVALADVYVSTNRSLSVRPAMPPVRATTRVVVTGPHCVTQTVRVVVNGRSTLRAIRTCR